MRYWIGRVDRILLLPARGIKRVLHQRLQLNEISDDMYLMCTWLKPILNADEGILDATRYALGSTEENIAPVQAQYVINVLDLTFRDDQYHAERAVIQALQRYVRSTAQAEAEDEFVALPRESEVDRAANQYMEDPGAPPVITSVSRSGRKTTRVDTTQSNKRMRTTS